MTTFTDVFGNLIELGDRVIHYSKYGTYKCFVESFTPQKIRIVPIDWVDSLTDDQFDQTTFTVDFSKIPDLEQKIKDARFPVNSNTLVCLDKEAKGNSSSSGEWQHFSELKQRLGI